MEEKKEMGKSSKMIPVLSRIVMFIGIIMVFMTASFTSKASVYEVDQINQTMNSVTVQLQPGLVKNVKTIRYGICEITKGMYTIDAAKAAHAQAISKSGIACKLSGNTYTFTNLKPGTSYYVCFGYNDNELNFTHNCKITTLPDKPTGVKAYTYGTTSNTLKVDFRSGVDEYKFALYNAEDELVEKGRVNNNTYQGVVEFYIRYRDFPSVKKLVITPVAEICSKDYYGESVTTYIIDQPDIVSGARRRKCVLKNGKLSLIWYKVDGATSYDIYISENKTSGYEKAATVKGKEDSVTIKKCHKKKIKKNKTYYVSIRPKYKKNGVTYTAHNTTVWEVNKKGSRIWRID